MLFVNFSIVIDNMPVLHLDGAVAFNAVEFRAKAFSLKEI